MLRFVFVLSGAFYLTLGGLLYFFPVTGLAGLTVTPTVIARMAGAVIAAWGLLLALSSARPTLATRAGLVTANLLVAATLAPAVLAGATDLSALPAALPLAVSAALVVLAILAITLPDASPREQSRVEKL